MKIDFRKIEVQNSIDEAPVKMDICKVLGNAIYQNTPDLGELDFASEIYHNGEVEIDPARAEIVRKYMDAGQFFARVKAGVNKQLDKVINPKKEELC